MSAAEQLGPTDPAPEHIRAMIAAVAPRPIGGVRHRPADAWETQLQRISDRIWAEAFHAGATWWAARERPPVMMLVTREERDRIADRLTDHAPPADQSS